jgi:hypothetical protein
MSSLGLRSMLTIPRLSYGASACLQRSHPTEVMKIYDWEIPLGVSCCESSCISYK